MLQQHQQHQQHQQLVLQRQAKEQAGEPEQKQQEYPEQQQHQQKLDDNGKEPPAPLSKARAAIVREAWNAVVREVQTGLPGTETNSVKPATTLKQSQCQDFYANQRVPLKRCLATCIPETRERMLRALLDVSVSKTGKDTQNEPEIAQRNSSSVLEALRTHLIDRSDYFAFWQHESDRVGGDLAAFRGLFLGPAAGRGDAGAIVQSHVTEHVRPLHQGSFFRQARSFWPFIVRERVHKHRYSLRGRGPRDQQLEKAYALKLDHDLEEIPEDVTSLAHDKDVDVAHGEHRRERLLRDERVRQKLSRLWRLVHHEPTPSQQAAISFMAQGAGLDGVRRVLGREQMSFSDRIVRYHANETRQRQADIARQQRDAKVLGKARKARIMAKVQVRENVKRLERLQAANLEERRLALSAKRREALLAYRDQAVERQDRKYVRRSIRYGDFDHDPDLLCEIGNPFDRLEGRRAREQSEKEKKERARELAARKAAQKVELERQRGKLADEDTKGEETKQTKAEKPRAQHWDTVSWDTMVEFEEALMFALLGPQAGEAVLPFLPDLLARDLAHIRVRVPRTGMACETGFYSVQVGTAVPQFMWQALVMEVIDLWTNTAQADEYACFVEDLVQVISTSARFVGAKGAKQVQTLRRLAEIEPGMRMYANDQGGHNVEDNEVHSTDGKMTSKAETTRCLMRWPETLGRIEVRAQAWTMSTKSDDARFNIQPCSPGPQAYSPLPLPKGFSGVHKVPPPKIPPENRASAERSARAASAAWPPSLMPAQDKKLEAALRASNRTTAAAVRELAHLLSSS